MIPPIEFQGAAGGDEVIVLGGLVSFLREVLARVLPERLLEILCPATRREFHDRGDTHGVPGINFVFS